MSHIKPANENRAASWKNELNEINQSLKQKPSKVYLIAATLFASLSLLFFSLDYYFHREVQWVDPASFSTELFLTAGALTCFQRFRIYLLKKKATLLENQLSNPKRPMVKYDCLLPLLFSYLSPAENSSLLRLSTEMRRNQKALYRFYAGYLDAPKGCNQEQYVRKFFLMIKFNQAPRFPDFTIDARGLLTKFQSDETDYMILKSMFHQKKFQIQNLDRFLERFLMKKDCLMIDLFIKAGIEIADFRIKDIHLLRLSIELGAPKEVVFKIAQHYFNNNKIYSIFTITIGDYPELVDQYLDHGFSIDIRIPSKNDCSTPLMWAAETCKGVKCLKQLLVRGADPNLKDALGNTALHYAYIQRSKRNRYSNEAIRLLLEAGADPKALNHRLQFPHEAT